MTVAITNTRISYTGNGVSTVYTYNFKILDPTFLVVYLNDTAQVLNLDYTVNGVGADSGGAVTFTVAPAAGVRVLLLRSTPRTQPLALTEHDDMSAESLEAEFDRVMFVVQEIQSQLDRVIQFAPTTDITGLSLAFPTPGAGLFIRWNVAGTALEAVAVSGGGGGGGIAGVASIGGLTGAVGIGGDSNITLTAGASTLSVGWAGLLPVTRGGLGVGALTNKGVLFGNNTGAIGATAAGVVTTTPTGSYSQVLTGDAGGPFFTSSIILQNIILNGTQDAIHLTPFGVGAGQTSELQLYELIANGSNYVGFKAPDAITANIAWTLPAADGSSGQVLQTDGAKHLSWVTVSGTGLQSLNGLNGASQTFVNDTNVTMVSAGTTHTITWAGQLAVTKGGTGTGTTFTQASVIFAGASGVYSQDNVNFQYDSTNKRLQIGAPSIGGVGLGVSSANAPAGRFEYSSSATNAVNTVMLLEHRSSADMIDGFGLALDFLIKDSAGIDNTIGQIRSTRAGADGTATLVLRSAIAGALGDRITVDNAGHTIVSGALSPGAFATASLPTTGTRGGRLATATTGLLGLWLDTHNTSPAVDQWVRVGGAEVHAGLFGLSTANTAANNKTALNAAIAALNAFGGGRLILPAGVYSVNAGLTTITVAAAVEGDGAFSSATSGTVLSVSGAGTLFTTTRPVWFKRFVISGGTTGIAFSGAGGGGVEALVLASMATGISIADSNGYTIRDTSILSTTTAGIAITFSGGGDGGDATITACIINIASGAALTWTGGGGLRFENNKTLGAASAAMLDFNGAVGTSTGRLLIVGNSIEGSAGTYGISFKTSGTTLSANVIAANQISMGSSGGILIGSANVDATNITGNEISGPVNTATYINITAGSHISVSGNLINGNGGTTIGVSVASTSGSNHVGVNTYIAVTTTVVSTDATTLINGIPSLTFANLPSAANGSVVYCSDGTIANPVASGGSGCIAKRLNGIWVGN